MEKVNNYFKNDSLSQIFIMVVFNTQKVPNVTRLFI